MGDNSTSTDPFALYTNSQIGFYNWISPEGGAAAVYCALATVFLYAMYVGSTKPQLRKTWDGFMSARRTTNRWLLGISFWVSGLGSYIFFSAVQIGTYAGFMGIVGYAWGSSISQIAIAWLGPLVSWIRGGGGRDQRMYRRSVLGGL